METIKIGSRWKRSGQFDPKMGDYNGYTVLFVTNMENPHLNHPPQVVYQGDNGKYWSLPLDRWPGSLIAE